jgi:hypothetical protein
VVVVYAVTGGYLTRRGVAPAPRGEVVPAGEAADTAVYLLLCLCSAGCLLLGPVVGVRVAADLSSSPRVAPLAAVVALAVVWSVPVAHAAWLCRAYASAHRAAVSYGHSWTPEPRGN